MIRCLCGGHLTYLHATDGDTRRTITGNCNHCGNDIAIQLTLRVIGERDHRCDSDAGYQAHRRRGEPPCGPCQTAHNSWRGRKRVAS